MGVDRYTDDGAFLGTLIASGSGGLANAQGVAVLPNGDLVVGDFANNNIVRFDQAGNFLGVFASGPAIATPFDIVIGTGNDVYVANAGVLNTVARLDPDTGAVVNPSFTSGNLTPISSPQYLEFGPTLALTDVAGHLFRFDATTGAHISTGILDNPEGVAYGANGDLYVAQRISDNVIRIPFGGGPVEIVIDNTQFSGAPADLEFGPNGLLYLSADEIYRFDVSGANGVLVDSFGTGGEFIVFYTPIPEPGTLWLLGGAVVAIAAVRLRR
jgi:hypothetical protein